MVFYLTQIYLVKSLAALSFSSGKTTKSSEMLIFVRRLQPQKMRHISLILTYMSLLLVCARVSGQTAVFSSSISSYKVNTIVQDKDGFIWMGTENGLNRYSGGGYKTFYSTSVDGGLANDRIFDLCLGSEGDLWIASETGCSRYSKGRFYSGNDAVYNPVSRVMELDDSCIVAFGQKGLLKFEKQSMRMLGYFYAPGISRTKDAVVSGQKEIWLTRSSNDSTYLDIVSGDLTLQEEYYIGKGVTVGCLAKTGQNTVFLSTSEGLRCFDSRDKAEIREMYRPLQDFTGHSIVHFIFPYRNGTLLLGVADRGMYIYDPSTGKATRIIMQSQMKAPRYVCFVDSDYNIWLSYRTDNVRFISGEKVYDNIFSSLDGSPVDFSHLFFDNSGQLWAISGEDIVCLDPEGGKVLGRLSHRDPFTSLLIDDRNRLWTIEGSEYVSLFRIEGSNAFLLKKSSSFREISSLAENRNREIFIPEMFDMTRILQDGTRKTEAVPNSLSVTQVKTDHGSRRAFAYTVANGVFEILTDGSLSSIPGTAGKNIHTVLVGRDGSLWMASYNMGVFHLDPGTGQMDVIDASSGLVDNSIKSILEDRNGDIWFSSANHITRYNPRARRLSVVHDDQYIREYSYKIDCAATGPDGKLFFGGDNGITVIDPDMVTYSSRDIPLFIEYLAVNGTEQEEGLSSLRLGHRQNSLQLRFAGIDFRSGPLQSYAYRLRGYESRWNSSNEDGMLVSYNSLPPGKYTFQARVRNQDGTWSGSEINLPVVIHPAIWATTFAKLLYALLALSLAAFLIRIAFRSRLSKERIALDREHIDLITNLSHGLRSPLSLIYGPLKELSASPRLDSHEKGLVKLMRRNAEILRMQSEQILGTSSTKPKDERLSVSDGNLSGLVQSTVDNFSYAILERGLSMEKDIPEGITGFFDGEKIEKILSNLLSNAIKYTPSGGQIKVEMSVSEGQAVISVHDNGEGIPEDRREKLFGRYERLGVQRQHGSGIGLNYSRHLARMHKGELVYSPNIPQGSIFTLSFPVQKEAYSHDEIAVAGSFVIPESSELQIPHDDGGEKEGTVLIVEDNPDIRAYIASLFSGKYRVMTASDGKEGEDNLKVTVPDIVISDVLMPRMNGYALCREIKGSPDWSHIPVILLTAKTDSQSSIEGMNCGADAYIPKPFDPDYLVASVKSLIDNRRRVQTHILNLTPQSINEESSAETGLNESEKEFIDKMHRIMDKHLGEEQFQVTDIADEMAMSYSSLYAKVKALTGTTPLNFMNTYRMNIAMELLRSGKYTVNEVSYRVGASSLSNFSRQFKKQFGVSPSSVK